MVDSLVVRYFRHEYCDTNVMAGFNDTAVKTCSVQVVWILSVDCQQPIQLNTHVNETQSNV